MLPSELLDRCIDAYKSFKAGATTIDAHAEDFVSSQGITDAADSMFIKEVAYGCVRYKKMLKVILTALYYKHGSEVRRDDYYLYMVFAYLCCVRLDDLGVSLLKQFVDSQEPLTMFTFLNFIFNPPNLDKWLKDEWCKIYDESFVNDVLVARILANLPEVSKIIDRLRARTQEVVDSSPEKHKVSKISKIEPFNLTKPRPRILPEPDRIPVGFASNPVPEGLFAEPKIAAKVEKAKAAAQEQTRAKHAAGRRFRLLTEERPVNIDKLREEADKRYDEIYKYRPPKANAIPKYEEGTTSGTVRVNVAQVLREEALFKKKQEKEAALLKNYEMELRDASKFFSWQSVKRREEEEQRLREVEKRRVEAVLADEGAKEARVKDVLSKKAIAAAMQREAEELKALARERELAVEERKREMVDSVRATEKNAGEAKDAVIHRNAQSAAAMREERDELLARAERERERDAAEKADLVRQIRALELARVKGGKDFDPTEVAGHDILDEMSLTELRERLVKRREEFAAEEEAKRTAILAAKMESEEALMKKISKIANVRSQSEREAVARREARKREEEERAVLALKVREEGLLELRKKLEAKRDARVAEEERLEEERRALQAKRQFLAADAGQVEEKKFKELEKGRERVVRRGLAAEEEEATMGEEVIAGILKNREIVKDMKEETITAFLKEYEDRLSAARRNFEAAAVAEETHKRAVRGQQRDAEKTLRLKEEKRLPYAAEVTEKHLAMTRGRVASAGRRAGKSMGGGGKGVTFQKELPPAQYEDVQGIPVG